jgi:hypothetical protein
MTDEQVDLCWILGFGAGANWTITPMNERQYNFLGECKNPVTVLNPGDEGYQDPIDAFYIYHNRPFKLDGVYQ